MLCILIRTTSSEQFSMVLMMFEPLKFDCILLKYCAILCYVLPYSVILKADDEGPDQTAQIRRLIWAFAVRIFPKTRFRMTRRRIICVTGACLFPYECISG